MDPLTAFQALVEAKSPPGWEDSVKRMKKHPEIDNPWALAWHMKNKGNKPHKKKKDAMSEVTDFQNALMVQRVVARVAKVHPSEGARREYLFEHPNADPKSHSVATKEDKGRDKADKDKHNESVKGDVDELRKEKAALKKQLSKGTSLQDPQHEERIKEIDGKIKDLKKQPKKDKPKEDGKDQYGRDKKNQTGQLRHLVNNQKEQLRQDQARLKRLKGDEAKDLASDIALDEKEIAKNESSLDKLKSAGTDYDRSA